MSAISVFVLLSGLFVFTANACSGGGGGCCNLALNKTGLDNGHEDGYVAQNAFDGNGNTRWSSQFANDKWIYVDLADTFKVDSVVLKWENACGSDYKILVSKNTTTWTEVAHITNGTSETRRISFSPQEARYVKMLGIQRCTGYGYSLWEFEVYGDSMINHAPTKIVLTDTAVNEGRPTGTTVGRFSTTDPDMQDTHAYTLVSGTGSQDNGSFTINGDSLKTAGVFNYFTKSVYYIRVRTTDNGRGNKWYEKAFTITVKEVENYSLWLHSKEITLNTSASGANVGTNVYNFPVHIRLAGPDCIFSEALNNGSDIRFLKSGSGQTPLSYEIERWDATNKQADIWVKVDTIKGNDSTQFMKILWGKSGATSKSNGAAVFDTANGFNGVWHLNNNPGGSAPQIRDATINNLWGTSGGSMTSGDLVSCVTGLGTHFDGSNDRLDFGNGTRVDITGHNSFTFSSWVKFNAMISGNRYDIMKKGDHQYGLQKINGTGNKVQFVVYDGCWWAAKSNNDVDTSGWLFLTGVYNGANDSVFLYVNGTRQAMAAKASSGISNCRDDALELGRCSETQAGYFPGKLDEAVLSKTVRNAAWIKLCYENQKVSQTLVRIPACGSADTIAPVVEITSPASGFLTRFSLIRIFWTVDGTPQTADTTASLVEGDNVIIRSAQDSAGNRGADTIHVFLDTHPPIVVITSPANGYLTNHSPAAIAWTVDGVTQTSQLSQNLVEGVNTITRTAMDAAGNTGSASITVTLDTHVPVVAITSPANGFLTNHTPVDVAWTVDGVAQTIQLTQTLVEGPNTITRSFTSAAGNTGSASITGTLDTHVPVVVITSPADGFLTNHTPVDVAWTVDGVAQTTQLTQPLTEGPNTITRSFTSAAGNTGTASITGTLDTHVPVVVITSPTTGFVTNHTPVDVAWAVDGVAQTTQLTQALMEGSNTITRSFTSAAGNTGTASISVTLITHAPVVAITSPADGSMTNHNPVAVAWTIDGVVQTTQLSENLVEGPNIITRTATDAAGNTGTASITVTMNTHAPLVEITSPVDGFQSVGTPINVSWNVNGVPQTTQLTENLVYGNNKIIRSAVDQLGNIRADTVTVVLAVCATYHDTTFTLYGDHYYSCLILTNGTITSYGKIAAGYVSIRNNGNLYMADSLNARYIEILSGGNISHPSAVVQNNVCTVYGLKMKVDTVKIMSGGMINVTGKGYPNGCSVNGQNTIGGNWDRGGSHGGLGYNPYFPTYDNYLQPENAGSGGGSTALGGVGGGIVRLIVGTFVCDGKIIANGVNHTQGDGAGGSVWITADSMIGLGSIEAKGGNYMRPGGGGRIAVYASDMSGTWSNNLSTSGYGVGSIYLQDGHGYHEIRFKDTSYAPYTFDRAINDSLVLLKMKKSAFVNLYGINRMRYAEIDSSSSLSVSDTLKLDSVLIGTNACLTHSASTADNLVRLVVKSLKIIVRSTGKIDVSSKGYPLGRSFNNQISSEMNHGGSHGGIGYNAFFGTYDNYLAPQYPGSGGGSTGAGAYGGGVVRIIAGNLMCDGQILANGGIASNGDGAGGSVWITADSISGSGSLQAQGGGTYTFIGGGGRIAVYATNMSGAWSNNLSAKGYGIGTIYIEKGDYHEIRFVEQTSVAYSFSNSISDPLAVLNIKNNGNVVLFGKNQLKNVLVDSGSLLTISDTIYSDSLTLGYNSTLTQPAYTNTSTFKVAISGNYLKLASTAKIDVTAKGYPLGRSFNNQTCPNTNVGGCHGGLGKYAYFAAYDDYKAPQYPGSGGGYTGSGSSGGGVVRINVAQFTCDGQILANGGTGVNGDGAGGSVWITAGNVNGNGLIQARGGAYNFPGGGGRIAVYATDMSGGVLGNLSTSGYGVGTIYLEDGHGYRELRMMENSNVYTELPNGLNDTLLHVTLGNKAMGQVTGNCSVRDIISGGFSTLKVTGRSQFKKIVYVGGGNIEFGDSVYADTCVFDSNTIVTHPATDTQYVRRLVVNAKYLRLYNGAKIDVTGLGYLRGRSINNQMTGAVNIGGSHGGLGNGAVFTTYDDYQAPQYPGSGGGGISNGGASGGGVVRIIAAEIMCDGQILANGGIGVNGDGAGGSVWITADGINGNGLIQAKGGAYNFLGGGGRIAVYAANMIGGIADHFSTYGYGVGSIYIEKGVYHEIRFAEQTSVAYSFTNSISDPLAVLNVKNNGNVVLFGKNQLKNVLVDSSSLLTISDTIYSDSFTLGYNSTLTHPSCTNDAVFRVAIISNCLRLASSAKIDVTAMGYLKGRSFNNQTTGAVNIGGSHGGLGLGAVLTSYDDYLMPQYPGSGGGGTGNLGSSGGGVVRIITGNFVFDGRIIADGSTGTNGDGGGGSVWITADNMTGNGSIQAKGGYYHFYGGGGRVAIYAANMSGTWSSNLSTSGSGVGTIYLQDGHGYRELRMMEISNTYTDIPNSVNDTLLHVTLGNGAMGRIAGSCNVRDIISNNYSSLKVVNTSRFKKMQYTGGGSIEFGDSVYADTCVLDSNTVVVHPATDTAQVRRLVVNTGYLQLYGGARIDVTGLGYLKGRSINNQTTGAVNIGGSHGGLGNGAIFTPYDDSLAPQYPGSGGGGIGNLGASGGGVVRINAAGFVCDGQVLADGSAGTNGDGAGGSIWITADHITGKGRIQAKGGAYHFFGGGGRIAVYCCKVDSAIQYNLSVAGYQSGSIYTPCSSGIMGPVVEIRHPTQNDVANSSPVKVDWYVDGNKQYYDTLENIHVGYNPIGRSFTNQRGLTGSDTVTIPWLYDTSTTFSGTPGFIKGSFQNSDTAGSSGIRLSNLVIPFNFIWVAVSTKGTVVKIDTKTGKVLGEYFTSPSGEPKDPSRTTVDYYGNVWVTNRAGNSVTRIGLLENGQCMDRNGDGKITTSQGLDDTLPWTNEGGANTNGGVSLAQDECICMYTKVSSSGTRHVSVTKDNDIWVSGTGNRMFDLVDGKTGQIKRTEPSVGYGGYGGLIDTNNVIWSARPMLRWDTKNHLTGPNGVNWGGYGHDSYGLAIDSKGCVWNSSFWADGLIRKFAPDGTLIGGYNQGNVYAQGCAVDRNDNVWVAHSSTGPSQTVAHLLNDGTYIGTVTVGVGPTGVAVDADNKIWATNYNSGTVSRIDPTKGPIGSDGITHVGQVDLTTVNLGGNLYNYSDMTGSTLRGPARSGIWVYVYDSRVWNAPWGRITWRGHVCNGGSIRVEAASGTTDTAFSQSVIVENGKPFGVPNGRYLKIMVSLIRASTGESPLLTDLSVATINHQLDTIANTPPTADAGQDRFFQLPCDSTELKGLVCDDGLGSRPFTVRWRRLDNGSGFVTFKDSTAFSTIAHFSAVGTYTLGLWASDGIYSTMDTVVVYQDTVNRSPVFVSTPVTAGNVGMPYEYIAQATDPDRGETIRYSLENPPGGMTIGMLSGQVSWAPADSDVGVHTIAIIAQDNHGATVRQEFGLTINPRPNQPPVFTSSAPTTANKGSPYFYQAMAQDPDNDPLSFLLVSGPSGMTVSLSGLVQWTPTLQQVGTNNVAIAVSDGIHSVNQQFAVDVSNVNNIPVIVSSPVLTATAGAAYYYQVVASDLDNDLLTYTLLSAPAGMTVSSGGLIEWPENGSRPNNAYVAVEARDPFNATATQVWNIHIVPDTIKPAVSITLSANPVRPGETVIVTVGATDNVAVASYTLTVAGSSVTLDANNQYSFAPPAVGTVAIAATATDLAGNIGTSGVNLTVSNTADNTPPTVTLSYSPPNPTVGDNVVFTISATDDIAIDPERTWLKVDGVYIPVVSGHATYHTVKQGIISAIATAYDMSGNYGEDAASVPVYIAGSDAVPPVAQIVSPAADSVILSRADVIGTATDANFAYYTLSYRNVNASEFFEYYRAFTPISASNLGVFDATLLENGDYVIRLTVFDKYGNSGASEMQVRADGNQKIGLFTLTFSDMNISLPGLSLGVDRTYDSRVKTLGDFGIGWSMGLHSMKLSESRIQGTAWHFDLYDPNYPLEGYYIEETHPHTVTITIPGGRTQVFKATAHFYSKYNPTSGYFTYDPEPGTYSKLRQLDCGDFYTEEGKFWDINAEYPPAEPYNPNRYELTLMDSTKYIIDQNAGGVVQMIDPNNNTVDLTPSGISHSAGKEINFNRDGLGRITSISDGTGRTISYTYDGHGNLQKVIDAMGNITRFKYGPNSYLMEIIDSRGVRATRTEYDEQGRLVRQINPAGDTLKIDHDIANGIETTRDFNDNKVEYTYDEHGNVRQKSVYLKDLPLGPPDVWTYEYDGLDNLLKTTNPDNTHKSSTFDAHGNELTSTNERNFTTTRTYGLMSRLLTETVQPNNRTTRYHYDPVNGNLLSITGPDNKVTSEKTYATNGNVLTETDGDGNLTTYGYNSFGQMTGKVDPLGRETKYVLDARGQTIADVNAKGDSTKYTFDANGNQVKTVNALGDSTKTEYTSFNKVKRQIDAKGIATRFEYDIFGQLRKTVAPDSSYTLKAYDGQGNVDSTIDEAGRVTSFEYDQDNRVVKTKFNDGSFTTVEYDAMGRRTASVDANGNRTEYGYDVVGNNTTVKDALNHVTTYEYDAANRRIAMVDALNHRTQYVYDDYDRLIRTTFHDNTYKTTEYDDAGRKIGETDQEGKTTAFAYDSVGNLDTVIDARGKITRYTYDDNNNRVTQTDANLHTTSMAYDKLNRLELRTYPNSEHEHFGYDANGNQEFKVDGEGDSTVFSYDVRNRELLRRYKNSGHTIATKYTVDGKPDTVVDYRGTTIYNYDIRGRQANVVNPDGSYIRSHYDSQGNRTSEKTPFDSVAYTYDKLNRMKTVISQNTDMTSYFYDAVGNRDSVANANGTAVGYHYDNLNRLVNLTNWGTDNSAISSYTYTLNNAGIRTAVTEADGSRVDYGYDNLYRLTSETRTGTHAYAISYVYDDVGNRQSQTRDGVTTNYVYNSRDQLTNETGPISYTYDHAGRMTSKTDVNGTTSYSWIDNDRMTSVSGLGVLVTYNYDASGQRVSETSGAATKKYLIDYQLPYGQVIAETDGSGSLVASYVFGQDRISMTRGAGTKTYVADGQGSIRQLTNGAGTITDTYDYTAFGEDLARTGTTVNTFRYVGESFDPNNGFYYNRARWYDPQHGTFTSVDPYEGDPQASVSLHRYLYGNASPIKYSDPSGEFGLAEVATIGAVVGILASVSIYHITTPPSQRTWKGYVIYGVTGGIAGATLAAGGWYAFVYLGAPVIATIGGVTYKVSKPLADRWTSLNNLIAHFGEHGQQIAEVTERTSYDVEAYAGDAVYVVENGVQVINKYSQTAYVRFMANDPTSKDAIFAYVVVDAQGQIITYWGMTMKALSEYVPGL